MGGRHLARTSLMSSKSAEWYTPKVYIEAAREVMGSIDLDPASCQQAQRTVKAGKYYTIANSGLTYAWFGNVWLNPPFCRKVHFWVRKWLDSTEDMDQGILLVNAVPDRKWFHELWRYQICFTDHRIAFLDKEGKECKGNTVGQVFVYYGANKDKFKDTFGGFGHIVSP